MIDDGRDFGAWIDPDVFGRELIALGDVDRMGAIIQSELFQCYGNFQAVRGDPRIEIDHCGSVEHHLIGR